MRKGTLRGSSVPPPGPPFLQARTAPAAGGLRPRRSAAGEGVTERLPWRRLAPLERGQMACVTFHQRDVRTAGRYSNWSSTSPISRGTQTKTTMRFGLPWVWSAVLKRNKMTRAGGDVEPGSPAALAVGMASGTTLRRNRRKGPQKTQSPPTMECSSPTSGYFPERSETGISARSPRSQVPALPLPCWLFTTVTARKQCNHPLGPSR